MRKWEVRKMVCAQVGRAKKIVRKKLCASGYKSYFLGSGAPVTGFQMFHRFRCEFAIINQMLESSLRNPWNGRRSFLYFRMYLETSFTKLETFKNRISLHL